MMTSDEYVSSNSTDRLRALSEFTPTDRHKRIEATKIPLERARAVFSSLKKCEADQ